MTADDFVSVGAEDASSESDLFENLLSAFIHPVSHRNSEIIVDRIANHHLETSGHAKKSIEVEKEIDTIPKSANRPKSFGRERLRSVPEPQNSVKQSRFSRIISAR